MNVADGNPRESALLTRQRSEVVRIVVELRR